MTPPSVFGSLKALDEKIFLERSTGIAKAERSSCPNVLTINDSSPLKLSPSGSTNILPTCIEQSGDEEQTEVNVMVTAASPAPSRKSSLKIRRGNSKRKKCEVAQNEILNNCKPVPQSPTNEELPSKEAPYVRKSSIQSDKEVLLAKANCIRNDTQTANFPTSRCTRVNVRRSSSIKSDSHQLPSQRQQQQQQQQQFCSTSNKYINNQNYYNLNRKNSVNVASIQHPHYFHQQYYQRRMSSFEQSFEKQSNINMNNFEDFLQRSMKVDLEKSVSSINNVSPTMPEQPQPEPLPSPLKKKAKLTKWLKEISNLDSWTEERDSYSLYIFPEGNLFRRACFWFVNQKWFDNVILLFIALNCITLAMERPNIPPWSKERVFLATANYVFTVVFAIEMLLKVVAAGMFYGNDAYFTSGWNIMDGSLVMISIIDLLMGWISESSPRIFGILRVFRLLRSLRPLRVINRAPGLKLVVQTLLSSLRPIGNIVLICCTFFIIFGILGVQLFKGTFFYCEGENIKGVKSEFLSSARSLLTLFLHVSQTRPIACLSQATLG